MRSIKVIGLVLLVLVMVYPALAQGGPGTTDFVIRDLGACVNLPDFTVAYEPDAFNTIFDVPGLFSINFAEYLLPLDTLPDNSDAIYNAMIALLDTVNARDYQRVAFDHPEYVSAAVEFTLDGNASQPGSRRMFGMIYRNQQDRLFFLFADKVEGFDMLAIGRAIFSDNGKCVEPPLTEAPSTPEPQLTCADTVEACATITSVTINGQTLVPGDSLAAAPGTAVAVESLTYTISPADLATIDTRHGGLSYAYGTAIRANGDVGLEDNPQVTPPGGAVNPLAAGSGTFALSGDAWTVDSTWNGISVLILHENPPGSAHESVIGRWLIPLTP